MWEHKSSNKRSFPEPFLGKITEWSAFTRHRWLQECGQVVRIGPNKLLFGDLKSIKDIYGQKSTICQKYREFYEPFSVTGARNVFSSLDRLEHSRIRRLLSHAFSMSSIVKLEPQLVVHIERFLQIIEGSPQPVDLFHLVHHLFLDIVIELSFDKSFNCLVGEYSQEAKDTYSFLNITALKGMFPWIEWAPTEFVRDAVQGRSRLTKFARQCVDEVISKIYGRFRMLLHHIFQP